MVSVSGGFFVEGKLPTVKDSRKTIKWNVLIGFPQQADKLEFVEMRDRNTFPRGEGAPVRTLGRMRNGDLFRICMHFVKKVHWKRLYSLT